VEVIVVGVIAAILGIAVTSVLSWSFKASANGKDLSHLQDQANVVLEDVARRVRNHTSVELGDNGKRLVLLKGTTRDDSLHISGGALYEGSGNYKVGGTNVLLIDTSSRFLVDSAGHASRINLVLKRDDETYKLISGYFRCRN
jgi:hypothetical protein